MRKIKNKVIMTRTLKDFSCLCAQALTERGSEEEKFTAMERSLKMQIEELQREEVRIICILYCDVTIARPQIAVLTLLMLTYPNYCLEI